MLFMCMIIDYLLFCVKEDSRETRKRSFKILKGHTKFPKGKLFDCYTKFHDDECALLLINKLSEKELFKIFSLFFKVNVFFPLKFLSRIIFKRQLERNKIDPLPYCLIVGRNMRFVVCSRIIP